MIALRDQVAAKLANQWSTERICQELGVTAAFVAAVALYLEAVNNTDFPMIHQLEKALSKPASFTPKTEDEMAGYKDDELHSFGEHDRDMDALDMFDRGEIS